MRASCSARPGGDSRIAACRSRCRPSSTVVGILSGAPSQNSRDSCARPRARSMPDDVPDPAERPARSNRVRPLDDQP